MDMAWCMPRAWAVMTWHAMGGVLGGPCSAKAWEDMARVHDVLQRCAELPAVARRLVSRGHGAASDFGALEVLAGASIAHTDPYRVAAALDAQLAAQDIDGDSRMACVDGW